MIEYTCDLLLHGDFTCKVYLKKYFFMATLHINILVRVFLHEATLHINILVTYFYHGDFSHVEISHL